MRAAGSLGVAMLTLHVAGGPAMLRAAVEAAHLREPCPELLGVTVLTSIDDADLAAVGVPHKVTDQVLRLAELAWDAGLDGVICSPHEVAAAARALRPGVHARGAGHPAGGRRRGDQKRTMGPAEAIAAGADLLVIGRPITDARRSARGRRRDRRRDPRRRQAA